MATFKYKVLEHHRKADGTTNIKIQIIHNRKTVWNNTPHFVTDKQLTKKLEIKDRKIIDIVNDLIKAYYHQASLLGSAMNNYTARELADYLERKVSVNGDDNIDFISFGKNYVQKLINNGQASYAAKFTRAINHLIDFFGKEKIPVADITSKNLHLLEEYLKSPHQFTRANQFGTPVTYTHNGLKNGVIDIMSCIRKLFNAAKIEFNDEDRGDIRIANNPFSRYVVGKPKEETDKRNLKIEDIIKIRDYDGITPGSRMELGRDVFMLSFYLIAMNTVDLFNSTVFKNGRIEYNRTKTTGRRKDNAFISIKVEPEAQELIDKYRDPKGKRVFKFYEMYSTSKVFNAMLNVGLRELSEKLKLDVPITSYWTRHSWPTIAVNQCRISLDDIAFAMNHINPRHRTTSIYIEKSWDIIDEANRKVLDQLLAREKETPDFFNLL
jgi:hypothetical protein